ncbi:TPA_asm: hypothetical protein [Girado virus 2]|nr:TPA_asm: hypothetical protein [Girado virus 2]
MSNKENLINLEYKAEVQEALYSKQIKVKGKTLELGQFHEVYSTDALHAIADYHNKQKYSTDVTIISENAPVIHGVSTYREKPPIGTFGFAQAGLTLFLAYFHPDTTWKLALYVPKHYNMPSTFERLYQEYTSNMHNEYKETIKRINVSGQGVKTYLGQLGQMHIPTLPPIDNGDTPQIIKVKYSVSIIQNLEKHAGYTYIKLTVPENAYNLCVTVMRNTYMVYCPDIMVNLVTDINEEYTCSDNAQQKFQSVTNITFNFHYHEPSGRLTTPTKRSAEEASHSRAKMPTLREEEIGVLPLEISGESSDADKNFISSLLITQQLEKAQVHDDVTGIINYYLTLKQSNKPIDEIVSISYYLNLLSLIIPYKNIYNPELVIFKQGSKHPLNSRLICAVTFQSFSLLLSFAKTITQDNQAYVIKRWNSFIASTEMIIEEMSTDYIKDVIDMQTKIKQYIIMDKIVSSIRTVTSCRQIEGLRAQIRMVYEWSQMASLRQMYEYSTTLDNLAIVGIPIIRKQAIDFKKAYENAQLTVGIENFPFTRVSIPTAFPELNLTNFKELYFASISAAINNGSLNSNGNFKMTEYATCIDKKIIKKYSKKKLVRSNIISEQDKKEMIELGIDVITAERAIKKINRSQRRSRSSSVSSQGSTL